MIIRLAIEDPKALEQVRARHAPATAPSAPQKKAPQPVPAPQSVESVPVMKRAESLPATVSRTVSARQTPETQRTYARAG
jgi:hypothetical protein